MTDRLRQWLVACIAGASVLGVTVAWTAYLNARSTPHWQQTVPGAFADPLPEGGMPMRLASLTVAPMLATDRGDPRTPPPLVSSGHEHFPWQEGVCKRCRKAPRVNFSGRARRSRIAGRRRG